MEDEYDVKKSRSLNHGKRRYRIRKTVMRIKKKAIFFLLTRMMRLICYSHRDQPDSESDFWEHFSNFVDLKVKSDTSRDD